MSGDDDFFILHFFILHSDVLKTPRVFARVRTESPLRTRDTRTTADRAPRRIAGTRLTRRPRRRFGRLTLSSGSSFSTLAQRYARFPPFIDYYILHDPNRASHTIRRPIHERNTLTACPARLLTYAGIPHREQVRRLREGRVQVPLRGGTSLVAYIPSTTYTPLYYIYPFFRFANTKTPPCSPGSSPPAPRARAATAIPRSPRAPRSPTPRKKRRWVSFYHISAYIYTCMYGQLE